MGKNKEKSTRPGMQDARLTLKLYDLRRETVMRESRSVMNGKFWPRTYEEFISVTKPEDPMNAAYRQVSSYWEMVYGMARHGITNADYLAEFNAEGILLFAKIQPFLERYRTEVAPTAFRNAEWIVTECEEGKRRFALTRSRVEQMLKSR